MLDLYVTLFFEVRVIQIRYKNQYFIELYCTY
jgi:hypothetical protein